MTVLREPQTDDRTMTSRWCAATSGKRTKNTPEPRLAHIPSLPMVRSRRGVWQRRTNPWHIHPAANHPRLFHSFSRDCSLCALGALLPQMLEQQQGRIIFRLLRRERCQRLRHDSHGRCAACGRCNQCARAHITDSARFRVPDRPLSFCMQTPDSQHYARSSF